MAVSDDVIDTLIAEAGGNIKGLHAVAAVIANRSNQFGLTPDQVVKQIRAVYDHVGGFGHLLNMGQAGFLEHDETVRGIRLFAREVFPQLQSFRA